MKNLAITGLLALANLIIFPGIAFSSGFFNGAQGAKAFSLGNAFVAQADDPSAIFFNPAGIVQLEGTQFSLVPALFPAISPLRVTLPGGQLTLNTMFILYHSVT